MIILVIIIIDFMRDHWEDPKYASVSGIGNNLETGSIRGIANPISTGRSNLTPLYSSQIFIKYRKMKLTLGLYFRNC